MSVIIDQFRISDDGKRMYINLHVNTASYFDNIYLDSITIMTADKVSETNPNEPTEDFIYKKEIDGNQKELNLVLPNEDISDWNYQKRDLTSDLFFLYVKIKGVPDPCTPCRLDEEITIGVTFDENLLYQRVMNYTKELLKDCTVPIGLADFILLWNAFKAAVNTEHWISAIKFYNMLFEAGSDAPVVVGPKLCGCHG